MADTLMFLKIGPASPEAKPAVTGESTAVGFADQIELEGINWGVSIKSGDKTGEAVQPEFGEVTLEKYIDVSTCTLLEWAKTRTERRKRIDEMTITYVDMVLDKAGNNQPVPVVQFTLHGSYFKSIGLSVGGGSKSVELKETLTITYKKVDVVYHPVGKERLQRGTAMTFRGLAPDDEEDKQS
jgi:type VI protein secretion system component Hcp